MSIIIKNGKITTSADGYKADIQIQDEKVTAIAEEIIPAQNDLIIDAEGCYLFPGGIDVHTHLDWSFGTMKTADDFNSGTKAAAVGGTTSIINFTNHTKGQTLLEDLKEWKERARPSVIDYGFHSIINDFHEEMLDEIPLLKEEGVTSLKVFMAYKGVFMINDLEMYKIMKKAGECGMITNVHAENGDVIDCITEELRSRGNKSPIYHGYSRPPELEAEATHRAIVISEMAKAPIYIVHVSSAYALRHITEAKKRGVQVYAETCPHYLALDISYMDLPDFEGAKYVCSPPLREKWNQDVLWSGINSHVICSIGSDHNPFQFTEKIEKGFDDFSKIPNGVHGIEDRYSILYHYGVHEGRISLQQFVEVTSSGPAKLFGMYPEKGTIGIGADADLVILDPNRSRVISKETHVQHVDHNIYEGTRVQGVITHVFSRGELLAQEGKYVGETHRGRFLHRKNYQKNAVY